MCCIFARMIEATATPSYQELLQQSIQQKQIIEILTSENNTLSSNYETLSSNYEKLSFELAQLKRMIFGTTSVLWLPIRINCNWQ